MLVGSEVESRVDVGLAKDGSGAGGKPGVSAVLSSSGRIMTIVPLSRIVCTGRAQAARG